MRDAFSRQLILTGAIVFGLAAGLSAQPRPRRIQPMRPPPPEGRQIETTDGDTVLIVGDDRVSIVRQRTAEVRVVFDQERRTVLVLADWGTPTDVKPDGGVNRTWLFRDVQGTWPYEARWQGVVTLVEPESFREQARFTPTLRLELPSGAVNFMGGLPAMAPQPDGTVIWHQGMSGGGTEGETFDQAERSAHARGANGWSTGSSSIGFLNEVVTSGVASSVTLGPATSGPVAVFPMPSSAPQLLRRVEPVWPDPGSLPGVSGVIVVRVSIAADGTVREAAIVRGLPPLDELALTAVRQWRFAAAGANPRPDPLHTQVVLFYPPPR